MTGALTDPPVTLSIGRLRGRRRGDVVEFRGIRYATAARFAPPRPEPGWTGVRDALDPAPVSPQLPARVGDVTGPSPDARAVQGEDCLHVDVRAPAAVLEDGRPRPVLVWLHGGAYVIGSATTSWYDTSRLVAEGDVVTVNVGYRLGVLGWLAAPGVSVGNLGLLDQIAALRWVRDHVAAFGGDAEQVTLMGQSAGAHAIACLMTVPEARPLFRRAILQSGQLGLGLSTPQRAARVASYVAEGLDGADPATASVDELLAAQRHAMIRSAGRGGLNSSPAFAPVDGVAPLAPGTTWAAAARSGHDVLVGSTADEAETFVRISPALHRVRRLPVLGRVTAAGAAVATRRVFGAPAERFADTAARSAAELPRRRPDTAARSAAELPRRRPDTAARSAAELPRPRPDTARAGRTFSYRFAWGAPASGLGACHCIELPFLFGARAAWEGAPMLAGASWDDDVEPLGAVVRRAWLSFVRTGNPWVDGLPWPPHSPGHGPTVVLGNGHTR